MSPSSPHAATIEGEVKKMVANWGDEGDIDLLDFFSELTIYTSTARLIRSDVAFVAPRGHHRGRSKEDGRQLGRRRRHRPARLLLRVDHLHLDGLPDPI